MTRIVLIVIVASIASGAPALSEPAQELTSAYTRPVILYPASHSQSKRHAVPAHAAFRYRKGGRCHHYHYYKPVVPDC
jgi:hypothetical protein